MKSIFVLRYTGGPGQFKDIAAGRVKDPGKIAPYSNGWSTVPPYDSDEPDTGPLFRSDGQYHFLQYETRERILPPQVLAREVKKKIDALKQKDGRPVTRSEKLAIRDELLLKLLPTCLIKHTATAVVIDTARNLIYVAAGSASRADSVRALLKFTFKGMNVYEITDAKNATSQRLTTWLRHDGLPENFQLFDGATLVDADGGRITLRHEHIETENIHALLDEGREVVEVRMIHAHRLAFTVTDELRLKGIDFTDMGRESLENMSATDRTEEVINHLNLWAGCLAEAVEGLFAAMPWADTGASNA